MKDLTKEDALYGSMTADALADALERMTRVNEAIRFIKDRNFPAPFSPSRFRKNFRRIEAELYQEALKSGDPDRIIKRGQALKKGGLTEPNSPERLARAKIGWAIRQLRSDSRRLMALAISLGASSADIGMARFTGPYASQLGSEAASILEANGFTSLYGNRNETAHYFFKED